LNGNLPVNAASHLWSPFSKGKHHFFAKAEAAQSRCSLAFGSLVMSQLWTWTPPSNNTVSLVAATDGGGLVVNQQSGTGNGSPQSVIRFDPSGNPTRDSWTSTAAASASALTNISYIAADAFSATQSGSTTTSLFSSGSPIDLPYSVFPAPAPDNASKQMINIQVFRLDPTQPNVQPVTVDMTERVNSAINFWQKQGILLNWNKTLGSNGIQISPLCFRAPCLHSDNIDNLTNVQNDAVIVYAQAPYFFRQFSNPKVIYYSFINYVAGTDTSAATINIPNPAQSKTFIGPSNVVVAAHSVDDVLPHETGHVFNLNHVRSAGNLMCGALGSNWFADLWPALTCSSW